MRVQGASTIPAVLLLLLCLCSPAWSEGRESASLVGLWRLMAVMPAGVPSEEVPQQLTRLVEYWFHGDGTLTLVTGSGTRESALRRKGVWRQSGRNVVVTWKTGERLKIKIVRFENGSIVLTGFDVRPLWFRFKRVF